ncbi:hypothetical protein PN51_09855 [Vibrio anguillarum]|uniref:Uncharacterized protein n=1 Tax=Vibrio ordalii FS-238 TaxID=617133 RepID=A0A853R395_9VIBR|nr:hypothetical protein PN51_09855 [Vibrio anguillarum]OEE34156.1 hypothetical protein A1QS_17425 [Vibrio ordalii FS-238]OEE78742.1 hypothetical protein A1QQ_11055 [Vibrio ordalii FF-167]AQP36631.1 hypothetical protein AA909_09800 [Vibrio anguillarum]OEE32098.1 hypothetical protein A1QW_11830 [Vibrio anguillarum]
MDTLWIRQDNIRMMLWTPLKEQVMSIDRSVSTMESLDTARMAMQDEPKNWPLLWMMHGAHNLVAGLLRVRL